MTVFAVFKTKSRGTTWHDELHCICGTKESAQKELKGLHSGYITDYNVK